VERHLNNVTGVELRNRGAVFVYFNGTVRTGEVGCGEGGV